MGSIRVQVDVGDPGFGAALAAFLAADPAVEVTEGDADVVVVGLERPDAPAAVSRHAAGSAVLALGEDAPELMVSALEAGALGYVAAGASFDQIAGAVHTVAEGHGVVPPAMLGALLRHVVHRRRAARADLELLATLTDRERQVLELVAAGLDRGSIARRLYISADTVRTHLQRVFRKLDVHTQAEAVAFAARCGLGSDPEEAR